MKKFILLFLLLSFGLTANCDYILKDKKGYRFACSKVMFTKKQAREINSKLFKKKRMVLKFPERRVEIIFDYYKPLSITERLNREQLELASKD